MTTNKQSEKREAPIMVIEEKTLKTLTKKENKMNNKPNYSLNKTIKSLNRSKKYPEYKLENNSLMNIKLPNGMSLVLSASENGEYCSMSVSNFVGVGYSLRNKGEFETEVNKETSNSKDYICKSNSIQHDNYLSYYKGETKIKSSFKFELNEFIDK